MTSKTHQPEIIRLRHDDFFRSYLVNSMERRIGYSADARRVRLWMFVSEQDWPETPEDEEYMWHYVEHEELMLATVDFHHVRNVRHETFIFGEGHPQGKRLVVDLADDCYVTIERMMSVAGERYNRWSDMDLLDIVQNKTVKGYSISFEYFGDLKVQDLSLKSM